MNQPKANQHYRLSLEKAKKDYEDGIITATGLVYYAVGICRKPGQKLRVKDIEAFCDELGIGVSTFYKAISKLKVKGRLNWEAIAGVDLWIPASNVVEIGSGREVSTFVETDSLFVESDSTNGKLISPFVETNSIDGEIDSPNEEANSPIGEEKLPKANSQKASGDSSNIYQFFFNSLSDSERESFEKFVREEWQKLTAKNGEPGEEIISLERFLAREEDLKNWHQRFLDSPTGKEAKKKAIATGYDWRNDPRFNDWIWEAFNRGYEWVHESEQEREQRKAFYDWTFATNAFEGVCL